ncbi:glutamate receptor 1-like [Bolinopsis microptera]|uniref:glutamate receptor 1-like n=1 Tax=Bolinopsis microptera TaxID=2820187 RepID=UPI003078ED23
MDTKGHLISTILISPYPQKVKLRAKKHHKSTRSKASTTLHNKSSVLHNKSGVLHNKSGVLHNKSDVLHNKSGVLHNKSGVLHNKSGVLHNKSGVLHNKSGVLHNKSGVLHNKSGVLHNKSGVLHNKSGVLHNKSGVLHNKSVARQARQALVLSLIAPVTLSTPNVKIDVILISALLYTNESSHSPLAFRKAIAEINENSEILPETVIEEVSINIGSDKDNPASATYQMCKLLREEDMVAVVGPFTSAQTKSCSYIAGQVSLPIISPTATDPNLNNPHWAGTLARLSPSNEKQAEAMLDLLEHFNWRRIAVVYTSDPYGVTLAEAVKELIIERGLDLITELEIDYEVAELVEEGTKRQWIAQLQNSTTRITLLLTQPDYGEIILSAAEEYGMVDSVYAWIASTAISEAMVRVIDILIYHQLFAYNEAGRMKSYYDGVVGLSPYLDVTGGFYRRLSSLYRDNGFNVLTVSAELFNYFIPNALVYDGVYLIANSLHEVYKENSEIIRNFEGECYQETPRRDWQLGVQMFRMFTTNSRPQSKYTGITGHRQMWPTGQPDPDTLRYNIVNFRGGDNNVTRVGVWEPKNRPKVTLTSEPLWNSGGSEVPADDPELESSTLKLGILEDKPFIIYNYTAQGYDNCADMPNRNWCYTGVSIEIIKRLQKRLKFEYEFVESPDGKFGSEVNGVWNGLINQVYQQNIDIGVVGFGTSHGRERVVDFGISFLPGGVRMATQKDAASKEYFFFLRPFSSGVWAAILIGMIVFFLAIYFLDRYSPYGHAGGVRFKCKLCKCEECTKLMKRGGFRDHLCPFNEDHDLKHRMGIMSLPNAFWLSVCSFLTYAPADGVPKNWSGRIVISVWWVICLVLVSMYTANLAAFLTVSRMSVDINGVEDLLSQKEYLFGTVEGTVTENLLRHSDSPLMQSVFKRTNQSDSFTDAVRRMRENKYIFMYGAGPLEYTSSTEFCDIQLIGEVLVHFGYAFAFQIDSPYLESFNREMLVMQEKGVIKDLWNYFVEGSCDEDSEFDAEADSLEVVSLLGILIISIPLFIIGLMVFGLELYASPKGRTGRKLGTGDVVKATFDLSPGLVKEMQMDEESFDLTTTQSIPPVSLDTHDGQF